MPQNSPSKDRTPLPQKQWLESLPGKKVAVQVLFTDFEGKILIVKPNYMEGWLLPGGVVEANESPVEAAIREVKEELNIESTFLNFAAVDYIYHPGFPDFIHIMLYGGALPPLTIDSIQLEEDEVTEMRFIGLDEVDLLEPGQAIRVKEYLKSSPTPLMLTNGQRLSEFKGGQDYQLSYVAGASVIAEGDKILLIQEAFGHDAGKWYFPAGHVDAGETAEAAAVREAREETGLEVKIIKRIMVSQRESKHSTAHYFSCEKIGGELRPQEGEVLALEWFTVDQIREIYAKGNLRFGEQTLAVVEEYVRTR